MRVPRLASLAAAAILALPALGLMPAATASGQASGMRPTEHIITALYAYPGISIWKSVTSNAPAISAAIVDMCAADGSGSGCDGTPWTKQPPAAWSAQIRALQNAGITPLVYIATGYGDAGGSPAFSLATVESQVSEAVAWYGRGIGVPTSCSAVPYYQALYGFVHALGGIVMLDPGAVTPSSSCYMPASDILGVFTGSEAQFQGSTFPSWLAGYPASRFSAVISAGTAPGVAADVTDAIRDGIGNVYVDDEAEPPGYATLPSFWPAEIAAMRQQATPAPLPG